MFETVLILPLIFVMLGLIFFFGQAFEREQQQRILTRYDAARAVNRVTPAAPDMVLGLRNQQSQLNELFFNSKADIVGVDWDSYPSPAAEQLEALASNMSIPTGDLAWRIFNTAARGATVHLSVDFSRTDTLPEAVKGAMTRSSTHPGPSWAYADGLREIATPRVDAVDVYQGRWVYDRDRSDISAEARIRDTFYADFDRQLDDFSPPATQMVGLIRGLLYSYQPGYGGPTVRYNR
jgi:hypothetical protein